VAVAGLFISHVQSPRIIDHFVRLRKESGHLVDWRFVFAQGRSGSPLVDFPYEPAESSMPLRFREMVENRGVIDGLLDTAIMPCAVALNSRFVWVMEYDVDFAGQWSSFFEQFSGNTVDLLTTTIVRKINSPTWYHWQRATAPSSILPGQMLRSFLPIMRLSREFACEYVKQTTQPGWRGHCEFTLPTVALAHGFSLEDIGGSGEFCPPSRRGLNYTNSPHDEGLAPGTFVFRPSRSLYYHESSAEFSEAGFLYHPVKPGVAEWVRQGPST
jgi:hypothetical protein